MHAAQLNGPLKRLRAPSSSSDSEASYADEQPRRKQARRLIFESDVGGRPRCSSDASRVPDGAGAFPRLEFKYPLLWYRSRFAWSDAEQERTLHTRATIGTHLPLSLPGRDGTVLVKEADGSCSKRHMASLPRHAADAYFRRLLEPLVASMLQACVRGWLTRRRLIGAGRSDASAALAPPSLPSPPPSPPPSPGGRATLATTN